MKKIILLSSLLSVSLLGTLSHTHAQTDPLVAGKNIAVVSTDLGKVRGYIHNGTFTYKGSKSGLPGMIDTQADVGGLEDYPTVKRESNWDTDGDGLPDWWENLHQLNPKSAVGDFTDTNLDNDKDGFTNLDDYLNWIAKPHFFVSLGKSEDIDLSQMFKGYNEKPVFKVNSVANGNVKLIADGKVAQFSSTKPGLATATFTVTDKDGSTMSRSVNFCIIKK